MDSSSVFQCLCLMFFLLASITSVNAQNGVFSIMKFGAVADGKTDISKAVNDAWYQACHTSGQTVVLIPKGTFFLNSILLKGPCKGQTKFTIQGDLKAPIENQFSVDIEYWINFQYVNQLVIDGGGSLDGQGPSAWPYKTCGGTSKCKKLPTTLSLDFITNSQINGLHMFDSKGVHINLFGCQGLQINGISIQAPADSPNTDGIHIGSSNDIMISDSKISTGDDCISLSPGSKNMNFHNVKCGPGHGISVGSLGSEPKEDDIWGITVRNCTFIGTDNGARIKTWAHSFASIASNITFQHIIMDNVRNPIIIDQQYCPSGKCQKGSSQVQIRDVKFIDISGTSSSKAAVTLDCSQSKPCQKIELNNIDLVYNGKDGPAISECNNVNGIVSGTQVPSSCIKY